MHDSVVLCASVELLVESVLGLPPAVAVGAPIGAVAAVFAERVEQEPLCAC